MKKRVLSLVLALALCLGLCPCLGIPAQAAGPVQISSAEDLIAFAERVNRGETDLDAVLTADVDMAGAKWQTPIYEYTLDRGAYFALGYTGTFDGGGHRISGLKADCGLFGKVGVGGLVKDLTVDAASISGHCILASCNSGTISNCHVSGELHAAGAWNIPHVGGLVSQLGCQMRQSLESPVIQEGGSILNCTSDAHIYFVSSASDTVHYGYYYVGGIVGNTFNETVTDGCFFSGTIEVSGPFPGCSALVGGIAASGAVVNCGNTGRITVHIRSTDGLPAYVGGIVGRGSGTVNCWNAGDIQVNSDGAPLACTGLTSVREGYGDGLTTLHNCWSTGNVTGTSDEGSVVSGQAATSETCYFLEGTKPEGAQTPTFTKEELYNGTLVEKLNAYVHAHPGEGLMTWVQGPNGPEFDSVLAAPDVNASGFTDVPEGEYYYEPVLWAAAQGITDGTAPFVFSPQQTCTEGQILTFLWRAIGRPSNQNVMPTVLPQMPSNHYAYDAFWWAVGQGMITGDFDPEAPCTRAAAVQFLWWALGDPEISVELPFTDVNSNADYAQAVTWALKTGVTSGTSTTTFTPDKTCTRGEIVTFLYRAIHP